VTKNCTTVAHLESLGALTFSIHRFFLFYYENAVVKIRWGWLVLGGSFHSGQERRTKKEEGRRRSGSVISQF
jgi:hypothetical protein